MQNAKQKDHSFEGFDFEPNKVCDTIRSNISNGCQDLTESENVVNLKAILKNIYLKQNDRIEAAQLLEGKKSILKFVQYSNKEIAYLQSAIFLKLFDACALNEIQEAYALICENLIEKFAVLKSSNSDCYSFAKELEQIIIVVGSALKPLTKTKNSIIVLHGLIPKLFHLIYELLPLNEEWILSAFPNAHQMLLYLAKSLSDTHNHFVATSELLSPSVSFLAVTSTSNYFSLILKSITFHLKKFTRLSEESQQLLFEWLSSIVSAFECKREHLNKIEILDLRITLLEMFADFDLKQAPELLKSFSNVLHRLNVFAILKDFEESSSIDRFTARIVRNAGLFDFSDFRDIWIRTPLLYLIRIPEVINREPNRPYKIQGLTLNSLNFEHISNFLLKKNAVNIFDGAGEKSWMSIFANYLHGSQEDCIHIQMTPIPKWTLIIDQYALYCVENRMKTPVGKTAETFMKFEDTLRKHALLLVARSFHQELKNSQTQKYYDNVEDEIPGRRAGPINLLPFVDWFRVRLLLYFIDTLDKSIQFTVYGSMMELAPISSVSRNFFLTNLKTCRDWITRVSLPLMAVSYSNGQYCQVVRFATTMFEDISQRYSKENSPTMDSTTTLTICWFVRAMVKLGSAQSIRGVCRWLQSIFGVDFGGWSKAAELFACGRLEEAIVEFSRILTDDKEKLSKHIIQMIEDMLFDAVGTLRHSPTSRKLYDLFMFDRNASLAESKGDTKEHKSSEFKKLQYRRLLELSSWDQLDEEQLRYIDDTHSGAKIKSLPWVINESMAELEWQILRVTSQFSSLKESWNSATVMMDDIADLDERISGFAQHILMNRPSEEELHLHTRLGMLHNFLLVLQQQVQSRHQMSFSSEDNFAKGKQRWINAGKFYHLSLLEIDPDNMLLKDWKSNATISMENGQFLISWMERLFRNNKTLLNGLVPGYKLPSQQLSLFHRTMSRLARKTGNISVAYQHLHFSGEVDTANEFRNFSRENTKNLRNGFTFCGQNLSTDFLNDHALIHILHAAKLRWNFPMDVGGGSDRTRLNAFDQLLELVSGQVNNHIISLEEFKQKSSGGYQATKSPCLSSIIAKMCMHLGNWVQEIPNSYDLLFQMQAVAPNPFIRQVLQNYDHIKDGHFSINNGYALQGSFLTVGSNLSYDHSVPKLHATLSDWAFKQMAQIKEDSSDTPSNGSLLILTQQEISYLQRLGLEIQSDEGKLLLAMLERHDTFEEFRSNISNAFKRIEQLAFFVSPELAQFWGIVKQRHYKLYETALTSCVRYLEDFVPVADHNAIMPAQIALRLLDMLTAHTVWFMKAIHSNWIDRIRISAWIDVIPQLFALLNHPETIIRQTVTILIEKVGQTSPHSICYPAIVNAKHYDDILDDVKIVREKLLTDKILSNDSSAEQQSAMCSLVQCSRLIVSSLSRKYPELMQDVIKFCSHVQRISLLHQEKLLLILTTLDHEITRRFKHLFQKRKQAPMSDQENNTINSFHPEESTFVMNNIIEFLSLTIQKMLDEDETTNEKSFSSTYRESLMHAIYVFKKNLDDVSKAWEPFKKIIATLNKQAMNRLSLILNTADISPYLSELNSSLVPIPGQEFLPFDGTNGKDLITIYKVNRSSFVLPTKTRPKKICFTGSNGKEYTFLLKGQEDLRLDERIMQLLRICNALFAQHKNVTQKDAKLPYTCTPYSVTPLGFRSGLIEWVNEATPLFQVYRKWRIRQANNEADNAQKNAARDKIVGEPERPMELFYRKLKMSFAKNNIPKEALSDRKKWPKAILEEVHKEMVVETPRNILSNELWMHSVDSAGWWRVTQCFARTAAMMSMIGSMIGLGDRHLDNVLINLNTGSLIHVDYNICFEKGRFLRAPETVPFRLTGNVVCALGPTKIEGIFRESSVYILTVLRENRDLLCSVMNTFVYDPLPDFDILESIVQNDRTAASMQSSKNDTRNILHRIRRKLLGYELVVSLKQHERLESTPPLPSGMHVLLDRAPSSSIINKNLSGPGSVISETSEMTPSEQVDHLIREATSLSNLSLMYEGWTSWV